MFTKKQILSIVMPLMIEQLLTILVGMADTVMVSSVGEAAVSGVSLVDQFNMVLLTLFSSFAAGGAVLCSQNLGKGDLHRASTYAKQLLLSNLLLSVFVSVIVLVFNRGILQLLYGSVEPAVMENAEKYFFITTLSLPFFAVYNALAASFRAEGNSRISMYSSVLMNIINVVGNAIGIYALRAGVYGVAVPTLLSRVAGAAMMCYAMRHSNGKIRFAFLQDNKLNLKMISEIYGFGIPMGMENALFQFGKVMLASLVSILGTSAVASYAIANKIVNFTYLPGMAIGMAVPAIVGQCMGAGEYKQAKQNAYRLLGIQYITLLPIVLGLTVFASQITSWFSLSPEASRYCADMVRINNYMMWIHPFAFMILNVFRAASDVRFPMVISVLTMFIFRVGLSYLFVLAFDTGVIGVYYAMVIDWVVRAIIYAIRFFTDKWIKIYRQANEAVG